MSQEELMEIYQENGLYGLKNDCGEVIISPQYREFYPFSCGLACVQNIQYQYSYIDINNVAVIPFDRYIWIDHRFTCGYARVIQYNVIEDKQYWGIINTMGFIVVPCEYDNIWSLNEKYLDNLKAIKNSKECRINLRNADKKIVLDGLKYIRTYTIDEFKAEFNVSRIFVRVNPNNVILFYFGTNIGVVSNDNYLLNPVISIVCNSAGKIFCLLHNRDNMGKMRVKQLIKTSNKTTPVYSRDYDSYDDYNKYVEESRLDAFEGDESNYWNID
ncbi:WG repeat-containing protein [uncultured Muribaculum sp.]|nr:WG repeat-containing protein [uncultured Muribaculum sp.]